MDMPKKKTVASRAAGILDELVKGPMTPEQAQDLMLALNKAVTERIMGAETERIMGAEMNAHLSYPPGAPKPRPSGAASATAPPARPC